jgi:hypothetical protein
MRAPRPWHESKDLMRDDSQEGLKLSLLCRRRGCRYHRDPYSGCQRTIPRARPFPSSLAWSWEDCYQRILTSTRRSILQGTMRCGESWAIHVLSAFRNGWSLLSIVCRRALSIVLGTDPQLAAPPIKQQLTSRGETLNMDTWLVMTMRKRESGLRDTRAAGVCATSRGKFRLDSRHSLTRSRHQDTQVSHFAMNSATVISAPPPKFWKIKLRKWCGSSQTPGLGVVESVEPSPTLLPVRHNGVLSRGDSKLILRCLPANDPVWSLSLRRQAYSRPGGLLDHSDLRTV